MDKPGLRERKKQRTREALTDAAYALFRSNGFDATTVDQIAEAVEVSSRTFFRYFTSKEDVALSLADEQITAMLDSFAAQPADVPVLTGLRRASVEVVRAYEADSDQDRYQRTQDLISTSPALMAACTERGAARLDEVARLVGVRMGVDPTADPRPHLVASVVLCSVQTVITAWRATGRQAPDSELIGQAFDLLSTGLDYPAARN
ncbi:TetR family transcriptional regulator [Umezawaea sp.]|uniref:TetR family transcriptional regulator n=1 Tax=Umezawaea sp. TaxID=1955258 RepID=UPI002ED0E8EC